MSNWLEAKIKERLLAGGGDFQLTEKECAFLRLCCQDIPYREIAKRMGKSPRTIDGYRDALFMLLQVRSRTGLVLWCFKSGFLKIKQIQLASHKNRKKKKPRQE